MHLERCARSDQKRIKIISKEREIKQEKLSVENEKEAEQEMNDLFGKPNNALKLVKFLKKGMTKCKRWTMFERNKWKTCIQREGLKKVWKEHMEKTINKENAWDQKTKIGIVESPMEEVSLEEITSAIKKK